jgi:hypothetical protein
MLAISKTLTGRTIFTYPVTIFCGMVKRWGFSYRRYKLFLEMDTTTPYSILHVGPFEFFIRPKSTIF